MRKQVRIHLLVTMSFVLVGCSQVAEQEFFIDALSEVKSLPAVQLTLNEGTASSSMLQMSYIVDSLIISINNRGQEYTYNISNIHTDQLLGFYGRRGRSFNEMLDCLPVMDTYRNKNNELCSDIFSIGGGRLFIWNISRSLNSASDCYDGIVKLYNDEDRYAFLSLYHRDDTSVVVKNSMQTASEEIIAEVPRYEIYDLRSGDLVRNYNIFKRVNVKTDDPVYTSKSFFGNFDCIKPDRTKLAFGMGYMPVYGILDLETGRFNGFKIEKLKHFSTSVRNWHFCNLVADDSRIYALYYGNDISEPHTERKTSTLFVIDWGGNITARYDLGKYFTELKLSDSILYFIRSGEDIHSIDVTDL